MGFSTTFGVATPLGTLVTSAIVTKFTGIASIWLASSGLGEGNDRRPHASSATWPKTETASPSRMRDQLFGCLSDTSPMLRKPAPLMSPITRMIVP